MKPYKDYPHSSISMQDDSGLKNALKALSKSTIEIIIESGTFNGLGSTTFIMEAFEDAASLEKFYTIELNYRTYKIATNNLAQFPKVQCKFGCSTKLQEAVDFMQNDEAILNHQNYTDIYIDDIHEPVKFYSKELNGFLGVSSIKSMITRIINPKALNPEENIIESIVKNNSSKTFLIVLDSAGGMGYLEFQKVQSLLKHKHHYLMLDDTHHLKHFRSKRDVLASEKYTVLYESIKHGSLLAEYQP